MAATPHGDDSKMCALNPHLFRLPRPNPGETPEEYERRCYQNDIDGISKLVSILVRRVLIDRDLKKFAISSYAFPHIAARVSQLLLQHELRRPGPFKKAAALTISLMERPLILYKSELIDPIMQWKLSAVLAAKMTQLYLIRAFGGEEILSPPQYPSRHFMGDFLFYLRASGDDSKQLMPIALLWEMMTYKQNTGAKKIEGRIDGETRIISLPGVDVPFDSLPGNGWGADG